MKTFKTPRLKIHSVILCAICSIYSMSVDAKSAWDYQELYLRSSDTLSFTILDKHTQHLIKTVGDTNDIRRKKRIYRDYGKLFSFETDNEVIYADGGSLYSFDDFYTLNRRYYISSWPNYFSIFGYKCEYNVKIYDAFSHKVIHYGFPCFDNTNRIKSPEGILFTGRYLIFLIGEEKSNNNYSAVGGYKGPYVIYDLLYAVNKRKYKKRKRKEARSKKLSPQ